MEGMLPPTDQERLVSSFLLFARGQTAATARNFLQATNWKRDEALELYLSGSARGLKDEKHHSRKIEQETRRPGVWESEQGATSLASLYCPPFHLMFNGSFNQAKIVASMQDKWLLVNIQSTEEFSSHMLNRNTWANDAVSQIIRSNFIFWQVYDDTSEGQKVCTNYGLDSIPVVLIIDPITGKKMRSWGGMVEPEILLEGLLTFFEVGPKDRHNTLSHKCRRGSSSPPKTKATVDSDASKEEDNEVLRELADSFKRVKQSSQIAAGDNKDANVAGNFQKTTLIDFEKLVI